MKTDSDAVSAVDREGTNCEKYDGRLDKFGRSDVAPLWVADMDFAAPTCVQRALAERVAHPVYGYSFPGETLVEALRGWFRRRHQWEIAPDEVIWSPGTVPALVASILALTDKGDRVLVPTPVYPPFLASVEKNGRRLVTSELLCESGQYQLDFDHIEQEAAAGARLLMLCSPHNPVGRVWQVAELEQLIEIALRHDMIIVSDDVHADFVYPGQQHVPVARLAPQELRLVTILSASKTFNVAGMGLTALVVSHLQDRRAIREVFDRLHLNPFNPLTMAAVEAAYSGGDQWLDELMRYLDENRRWLHDALTEIPGLKANLPEATFLTWVDCRELGMTDTALHEFLVERAGLGVTIGPPFGPGGQGYIRLNFGTRRSTLERAVSQLKAALSG